jgi:hypothetical protein
MQKKNILQLANKAQLIIITLHFQKAGRTVSIPPSTIHHFSPLPYPEAPAIFPSCDLDVQLFMA